MLAWVILLASGLTSSPAEASAGEPTVVKQWRFDSDGDTEGWVARHDLENFTVADGALRMTITGPDPYFHAPPYEFDGLRAHLIEVRALLPDAAKWHRMQLFFGTPDAPHHSPERNLSALKTEGDGAVIFLFDLHGHEQARGRVRNIRLDIDGAETGSVARIDSIRLLRPPAKVRTHLSIGAELVRTGDPIEMKLRIENAGGEDAPALECALDTGETLARTDAPGADRLSIPALAPCDAYEVALKYRVLASNAPAYVRLVPPAESAMPPAEASVLAVAELWPADMPPRRDGSVFQAADGSIYIDGPIRIAIQRLPDGRYGPLRLFAADGRPLGAAACLVRQCSLSPSRTTAPFFPTRARIAPHGRAATFWGEMDAPGLTVDIAYAVTRDRTIHITHRLHAKQDAMLYRFDGPSLRLGEACFGAQTVRAIFPGLEYLGPGESSSSAEDIDPPGNARFSPEPTMVTIPIMIHQGSGPAVGLSWDNVAKWAPGEAFPTPLFSSPNAVEGQENHLMGLFAPSVPKYVHPNTRIAHQPYALRPGGSVRLSAEIWAGESPEAVLARYITRRWNGSIPKPARSWADELKLCRFAYTDSCYDPEQKGWVHAHGGKWPPAPHAFNILALLMDAAREPDAKRAEALRALAMGVYDSVRARGGFGTPPPALALFFGDVESAVEGIRAGGSGTIPSQLPSGGWRFVPDEKRASLARWGDESLGVTGSHTPNLQRAALVTADPALVAAFMGAVEYCDRFHVPRGAQTWECAVHTPDIMASADGVEIYLAAYQLTGELRYLERARHWAISGLPFVFFWRHPRVQALHFSTIPVFGATHYRGSWFGRPVQWCGLDYAKSLIRLSRFEDKLRGEAMPWRRVAEGILRSAMIQQYADGPTQGCYPDFWLFRDDRGAGPAINPQLILTNLWMHQHYGPDIRTVVVPLGDTRAHVSALAHVVAEAMDETLHVRSKRPIGSVVAFIVANIGPPKTVRSSSELVEVSDPGAERGYRYDADARLLTATVVAGANGVARLEIELQMVDSPPSQ